MPVTDPHRPRGFRAELADAVSPKAIGLIAGVLLLQLGFILSYIGAFHSPSPHRVRVVVAAPASAQQSIITQLNGLAGEPVRAVATTGADAARAAVLDRTADAGFVLDPTGTTDTLLTASAAGPAVAQVATDIAQRIETSQHRSVRVVDIRPPAPGDGRGLSSFYLVVGWMVGGYLAASILGIAAGARPPNRRRAVIRLGALAVYAVLSGLGGALISGPVLDALPRHLLALTGLGALVVFAAASVTMALQVLLGVLGIGVTILFFVVLGNPSAGGPYPSSLLPPFWRVIGPWLPPGAGTTAVRNTVYFDGHAIGQPLVVLVCYLVLGSAVAIAGAGRRPAHRAPSPLTG